MEESIEEQLGEKSEAMKVVRPNFDTVSFPNAVIRGGVVELTLRRCEEGTQRSFFNTAKVEAGRWRPPLVDVYRSVEGSGTRELVPSSWRRTRKSTFPKWK